MSKIFGSITELVGHTPLVELRAWSQSVDAKATIIAKLESFNPLSSVKDRAALSMIEDAQNRGLITKGSQIIEPTSGNTGIALAYICASMGYRLTLVMPESMTIERRKILLALGAQIVLTPAAEGMKGAISTAQRMVEESEDAVTLAQFDNCANPNAHIQTTGPEIWDDTDGGVDVFVAGVGTGGTISGVGSYLKTKRSTIEIVAVEPASSPVLSGGSPSAHKIQGIGAGFVPANYYADIVDRVVTVSDDEAAQAARNLALTEGILVGISSGAALAATTKLAQMPEYSQKRIVVLLPDTGERYLSTPLFDKE